MSGSIKPDSSFGRPEWASLTDSWLIATYPVQAPMKGQVTKKADPIIGPAFFKNLRWLVALLLIYPTLDFLDLPF